MESIKNFLHQSSCTKTTLLVSLISWSLLVPYIMLCGCQLPRHIEQVSIVGKLAVYIPNIFNHSLHEPILMEALSQKYFIDTSGCRMRKFDVMNEEIADYLTQKFDVQCGHERPMTQADNEAFWIGLNADELRWYYNVTELGLLTCYYWPFDRLTDKRNNHHNYLVRTFQFGERVNVTGDKYVKVICAYGQQRRIYEYSHIFLEKPQQSNHRLENKPNVVVLGLDSISRLNFYRQMTETTNLLNQLGAKELQGYSKVEDNTYPNLIPVLTGFNHSELDHNCLPTKNSTFDNCSMVWNDFKRKGYKTLFAEDSQSLGLFNYQRGGYAQLPTDLYPRNYFMDLERTVGVKQRSNAAVCLGVRNTLDVFLDYVKRVTNIYRQESLFAFLWTCAMTHDLFESVRSVDITIRDLLQDLNRTGYLNNTVLVLMSDHGLRFGLFRRSYQGMIEERQPFLYMVAPSWYRAMYPQAFENFRTNSKRLTTHFDLHETLKDLSEPASMTDDAIVRRSAELNAATALPRGISLFLPIAESRTCETAAIKNHWCTCHEQFKLQTTSKVARIAAKAVVGHLNALLMDHPQCRQLTLSRISDANVQKIQQKNLKTIDKSSDVVIALETRPGFATFEATVRVDIMYGTALTAPVSRTNMYGNQSWCVEDAVLKLYCYC